MSNEELALLIQAGDSDAVLQLWNQTQKFISFMANKYRIFTGGLYEIADLEQSGFIAMLKAAETYMPERETAFITCLKWHLKNEFARANGLKPKQDANNKRFYDPVSVAISIYTPVYERRTIADLEPDPRDHLGEVERRIYLEQLQQQLNKAIAQLPEDQQQIIKMRYLQGKSLKQISTDRKSTQSKIQAVERKALDNLRNRRELEQFIDDRTPFYGNVSVNQFMSTHESIVVKCVFKRERIRNDNSRIIESNS